MMQLTELKQDTVTIMQVAGRLDAQTGPEFLRRGAAAVARGEHRFVIDCRQLEYLSSGGLRACFALGQQLPPGGTLVFAGPNDNVRKVMVVVELDRDYPVIADFTAALAAART
ncbi:MAG TPA: STAS domain-containing protein [bacterium]|nr:STAS domain-containing protein [bacterium]